MFIRPIKLLEKCTQLDDIYRFYFTLLPFAITMAHSNKNCIKQFLSMQFRNKNAHNFYYIVGIDTHLLYIQLS